MHSDKSYNYGLRNLPEVTLNLYLDDYKVHSLIFDTLTYYDESFETEDNKCEPYIELEEALMNIEDYKILTKRRYDKYQLIIKEKWTDAETFNDSETTRWLFFEEMKINHIVTYSEVEPWRLTFRKLAANS